jgi:hypothetical protein
LAFFEYFFYGLGQQQSQKASAEAKLKKGGGYKRVTIGDFSTKKNLNLKVNFLYADDLMAKKELSFDSLAKLPNRDLSRTEEKTAFTYKRVCQNCEIWR